MSRIKVGGVWIDEGPSRARVAGYVAKSSTGGFLALGGEVVRGGESQSDRDNRLRRERKARKAKG